MQDFRVWLAQARITDTPQGDLIADMRDDLKIPNSFADIEELRSYLRSRGTRHGTMAAVASVWRLYRRWQVKQAHTS
jgi:uncharacterized protein YozE (UPF0346 family)